MDLFEVREGRAFPSTHALIIKPFKTIWETDVTPDHGRAILAFTFIELNCSPKKTNPYWGYDPDTRYKKLKEEVYDDENYVLNDLVVDGIVKYEALLAESSISYPLIKASINASYSLRDFFNNVDLEATTNSGAAKYKPKDITSGLKDIADVVKNLELLRDKVHSESLDEGKTRKDRDIGFFEE